MPYSWELGRFVLPIAVIDNDGHAEIVFTTDLGVTVVGDMDNSWRRSRVTWNQHTYHITNVIGVA